MSYIRAGHPLVYVEGFSKDYVYPTFIPNKKKDNGIHIIEDFGGISDSGFIELLFRHWHTTDTLFKEHLLKRLAQRLDVKIRKKPLTDEERTKLEEENTKKFIKDLEL